MPSWHNAVTIQPQLTHASAGDSPELSSESDVQMPIPYSGVKPPPCCFFEELVNRSCNIDLRLVH